MFNCFRNWEGKQRHFTICFVLDGCFGVPVAPGIKEHGGSWQSVGVLGACRGFGFGCFSARGFPFCEIVPLLWPWATGPCLIHSLVYASNLILIHSMIN